MKYSVITFGCRVNQADSIGFEEDLRAAGAVAASSDEADVVIVNTCSVTSSPNEQRSFTDTRSAVLKQQGCKLRHTNLHTQTYTHTHKHYTHTAL